MFSVLVAIIGTNLHPFCKRHQKEKEKENYGSGQSMLGSLVRIIRNTKKTMAF